LKASSDFRLKCVQSSGIFPFAEPKTKEIIMNYFIVTALVALAASKTLDQSKDNQTHDGQKHHVKNKKVVTGKVN
jgi:hypothetical protein